MKALLLPAMTHQPSQSKSLTREPFRGTARQRHVWHDRFQSRTVLLPGIQNNLSRDVGHDAFVSRSGRLAFGQQAQQKPVLTPSGYFAPEMTFEHHFKKVLGAVADNWIDEMNKTGERKPVIVAMDGSALSENYLPRVIDYLVERKLDVYTYYHAPWKELPMPLGYVAYFAKNFDLYNEPSKAVAGAIMLTSGTRALDHAGMRFISPKGGLFTRNEMAAVQAKLDTPSNSDLQGVAEGRRIDFDFMQGHYRDHLERLIQASLIKLKKILPFHDARYGASREQFFRNSTNYTKEVRTFNSRNDITVGEGEKRRLDNELNTKTLLNLRRDIQRNACGLSLGLANNVDASLCRVVDEKGRLLSPTEVGCLLLAHLVQNKGLQGVLVKTHDVGSELSELASVYGIPVIETPSGGHYLSEAMQKTTRPLLLGVDAKGGYILPGHLPIKDGFTSNFFVMELLAKCDKPLSEILQEIRSKLVHSYQQSHFEISTKENLVRFLSAVARRGVSVRPYAMDSAKTRYWQQQLERYYGEQEQVKIFFQNGSSFTLKKDFQQANKYTLTIDTPHAKNTWFQQKTPQSMQAEHAEFVAYVQALIEGKVSGKVDFKPV